MADRTDRTACSAFELLATAYHEAGHAVGAILGSPELVVESASVVPGDDDLGRVTFENWSDLVIPDPGDEDLADEGGEHERTYWKADVIATYLGGLVEVYLRTGDFATPCTVGWGADRAQIIATGDLLDGDLAGSGPFARNAYGHAWMESMAGNAIALTERHDYFWLAVGLVAGALIRQKTLDGSEVMGLVRVARGRGSAG